MKIAVVGTGYVGLLTGACLSDNGNEATCVDIDRAKIARLHSKPEQLDSLERADYQELNEKLPQ